MSFVHLDLGIFKDRETACRRRIGKRLGPPWFMGGDGSDVSSFFFFCYVTSVQSQARKIHSSSEDFYL